MSKKEYILLFVLIIMIIGTIVVTYSEIFIFNNVEYISEAEPMDNQVMVEE